MKVNQGNNFILNLFAGHRGVSSIFILYVMRPLKVELTDDTNL